MDNDTKTEFVPSPAGAVFMLVVCYLSIGRCISAGMWLLGKNLFGLLAGIVLIALLGGAIWHALYWAHILYLKIKGQ